MNSIELSDRTKILILIAIVGVVVFFFIKHRTDDDVTHNEGSLKQNVISPMATTLYDDKTDNVTSGTVESVEEEEQDENSKYSKKYLKKFITRDTAKDGKIAYSNYADGKRGGSSEIDKFFEEGNPLTEKPTGFQKSDLGVQYAGYIAGKKQKMREVDKFNASELLPREKGKDWFDDPYESTSVKNTHLINIYRPIGVNTIQTTLKNPSHDIRGTPANPKLVTSPWMNSSYEPDNNLKNLC
jgi:hypothetical protein